jgi:hypothetical protein
MFLNNATENFGRIRISKKFNPSFVFHGLGGYVDNSLPPAPPGYAWVSEETLSKAAIRGDLAGLSGGVELTTPPPGYAWVYSEDGLSGLGKFKLKKVFKSVVNVAKKVVLAPVTVVKKALESPTLKKIAKVAAIAAAVYFTGGAAAGVLGTSATSTAPWFSALASKIGTVAATQLVQGALAKRGGEMTAEQIQAEAQSATPPSWLADDYQKVMGSAGGAGDNPNYTLTQSAQDQAQSQAGSTSSWAVPAAIGGAGLLLTLLLSR